VKGESIIQNNNPCPQGEDQGAASYIKKRLNPHLLSLQNDPIQMISQAPRSHQSIGGLKVPMMNLFSPNLPSPWIMTKNCHCLFI
jgi:hypothetical protein